MVWTTFAARPLPALAAIVLGPWEAILVMTAVIAVQALLFQDGGLLVMGTNIFNMGILTAVIGFGLYRIASGTNNRTFKLGMAALGAWLSTIASALITSLQLWIGGTSRLEVVVPAMLGVHILIGLGEALITAAALSFIMQSRPDLLESGKMAQKGGRGWIFVGAIVSLATILLSPFASADPDGLERVATDLGFLGLAKSSPYQLLPDYTIPVLGQTALSTVVAGAVGALVVLGIMVVLGSLLRQKKETH